MSMLALTLLCTFYFLNVKTIGLGQGYVFLAMFLISTLLIKKILSYNFVLKKNLIIVFIFLTYIIVRYVLDNEGTSGVVGFSVGTNSGILFGFGLGIFVSYVLSNIYHTLSDCPCSEGFFSKFLMMYFALTLYFVVILFLSYMSIKVDNAFLIDSIPVAYQRPGILIFIFNIQNAILFAISKIFLHKRTAYFGLMFYTIAGLSAILSQLIGSNFAFVAMILLIGLMVVYAKLVNRSRGYIHNKKLTFKSIFFGWIAKEVLITGSKYILMLTVLLYVLTELSMIDLTKLRLFGDNWEIDSITARIELVQGLFIKHFNFAPIFGNMTVNSIMGDQYIHSLIAFFTHLGITGMILFLLVVYFVYRNIAKCGAYNNQTYYEYQLLRLLIFTFILIMAFLGNFFTWIPLWFVFGLFASSFISPRNKSILQNS